MAGNSQRTEKLRCLKYGSILRLCRGHFPKGVFSDDAMGRAHLFELVCVASLAPACAEQKVEHLIGLWAYLDARLGGAGLKGASRSPHND